MEPVGMTGRYEPMDQCSIDLLRILSTIRILPCYDLAALQYIITDALAVIVFAAVESGSTLPFDSQTFRDISDQVIHFHRTLDANVHQPATDWLLDFGSENFILALGNKSAYFACTGPVFRVKSVIITLILAFMDEWSDIHSGIDALQLLPCSTGVNPQGLTGGHMLGAMLSSLNVLSVTAMKIIALGMPEFVVFDDEDLPQLHWHPDIDARMLSFEKSKRDRAELWPLRLAAGDTSRGK